MTVLEQLECDSGDKCIIYTPADWANKYNLYAFKITDGPIVPGTSGPRSKSATGSARLEVAFAAAPNENIMVILIYQMLGRFEFDKLGNVIVL